MILIIICESAIAKPIIVINLQFNLLKLATFPLALSCTISKRQLAFININITNYIEFAVYKEFSAPFGPLGLFCVIQAKGRLG
ncbi:hypothetical protein JV59_16345 [Vibrio coralliilyticus]|nr:hypothetical protein JV59_16345 [Vibrio coralliilyticus]